MIVPKRDEWEIREDARTLARAEEIKADKARYNEAVNMAKTLVKKDKEEIKAMVAVANKKELTEKDSLRSTFSETLDNIGASNGRV